MKKRVLSMFMALALCLTLLPAPVRAAEDTPESGAIVQQEQQEEISPAVSCLLYTSPSPRDTR